jgi:hypothetical protein
MDFLVNAVQLDSKLGVRERNSYVAARPMPGTQSKGGLI